MFLLLCFIGLSLCTLDLSDNIESRFYALLKLLTSNNSTFIVSCFLFVFSIKSAYFFNISYVF